MFQRCAFVLLSVVGIQYLNVALLSVETYSETCFVHYQIIGCHFTALQYLAFQVTQQKWKTGLWLSEEYAKQKLVTQVGHDRSKKWLNLIQVQQK